VSSVKGAGLSFRAVLFIGSREIERKGGLRMQGQLWSKALNLIPAFLLLLSFLLLLVFLQQLEDMSETDRRREERKGFKIQNPASEFND